jgi:hypothetical protein
LKKEQLPPQPNMKCQCILTWPLITLSMTGQNVMIRTLGYENIQISVTVIFADGSKLLSYVILSYKTVPKEQLPRALTVSCQSKGWIYQWKYEGLIM